MRIPPDLDQLMWFLAESADLAAISEFRKRFPDLEPELLRRQSIVRHLKGARPDAPVAASFEPRESVREYSESAPRWVWAAGAVAVVSLAVASYFVTQYFTQKPVASRPPPVSAPQNPGRIESGGDFDSGVRPVRIVPQDPDKPNTASIGPGDVPAVRDNRPALWAIPRSVILEEAPLYDVLQTIANESGLQLEIAPNTPNPTVSVSFEHVSGIDMVKELGKAHGFTALEQGDGKWLIVPATQWTDPQ